MDANGNKQKKENIFGQSLFSILLTLARLLWNFAKQFCQYCYLFGFCVAIHAYLCQSCTFELLFVEMLSALISTLNFYRGISNRANVGGTGIKNVKTKGRSLLEEGKTGKCGWAICPKMEVRIGLTKFTHFYRRASLTQTRWFKDSRISMIWHLHVSNHKYRNTPTLT